MRIDRDARHAESRAENDVRRLAAHAGQRDQFLHRGRYLAVVQFHKLPAAGEDALSFVAEKARRLDHFLQLALLRRRERVSIGIAGKQGGRDAIDALIRALRRQNRGNEQLQRIGVVQSAMGIGILLGQLANDAAVCAKRVST